MPNQRIDHEVPDLDAEYSLDSVPGVGSIGDVPVVTFQGPEFDENSIGVWGFGLSVHYFHDMGLRFSPKAGAGRSGVAIWRAHSEISYKIVDCACSRVGYPPVLPAVDTGDDNDVLISCQLIMKDREYFLDGVEMIVTIIQYVYVQQMARSLQSPVFYPNSVLRVNAPLQLNPGTFSTALHGVPYPPPDFSGGKILY